MLENKDICETQDKLAIYPRRDASSAGFVEAGIVIDLFTVNAILFCLLCFRVHFLANIVK